MNLPGWVAHQTPHNYSYAIDKAMRGTSTLALAKAKILQRMHRFEYLNSEGLIEW
jgi:hypothetical protein